MRRKGGLGRVLCGVRVGLSWSCKDMRCEMFLNKITLSELRIMFAWEEIRGEKMTYGGRCAGGFVRRRRRACGRFGCSIDGRFRRLVGGSWGLETWWSSS